MHSASKVGIAARAKWKVRLAWTNAPVALLHYFCCASCTSSASNSFFKSSDSQSTGPPPPFSDPLSRSPPAAGRHRGTATPRNHNSQCTSSVQFPLRRWQLFSWTARRTHLAPPPPPHFYTSPAPAVARRGVGAPRRASDYPPGLPLPPLPAMVPCRGKGCALPAARRPSTRPTDPADPLPLPLAFSLFVLESVPSLACI